MAYVSTYYKGDTISVEYWSTSNPGITLLFLITWTMIYQKLLIWQMSLKLII
ncbi:hypothetical protein MUN88_20340 [Gracilibacillus caseinilyticus]|uniref:Uncharacterized protein n=1 Tax=Gracilibacillus caseinilyticus TaxID=2932256 RepID=A0ABY4F1R5_9BACI|nr:hypothetical protein [Gracilibacillus caseinilyticus]UOQ48356.1 hypothetical protein MUN88_20340 [Gracilibacillus caseinilyticus]